MFQVEIFIIVFGRMTDTPAPPPLETETLESRSFKFNSSSSLKKERKSSQEKKAPSSHTNVTTNPATASSSARRDSSHRRGASGGNPLAATAITTLHRDKKSRGKLAHHPLSKSTETILFHADHHDPNPIVPNKNPGTPDVWVPRTIRA